ncbi:MAG: hypothetical protein ABI182_04070 [Candidatus Baltobacteraceae bacterium]
MRTLSEVFTPAAPSLPEGLRTLVVSPERELEPGMTVRASFTFRNQGGAPATGVRVRMNVPEGLVYLVGSGQIDGVGVDDEQGNSPLLSRNGAHIGDVASSEERRIEIAYSVAGAIENGSTVELQAAVAAFEIAPVGSNLVRLVARSQPVLNNPLTNVSIEGRGDTRPGSEALVTVRVHNAGESSAHDVVVVAPIPDHATYIANSARVGGRDLEREMTESFDRVHAPVIAKSLPASATATLTYRIRLDDPLPSGTQVLARATIASQETAGFAVEGAALSVVAQPNFDDDQTAFTVDPAHDAVPGQRLTLRLHAANTGTTAADDASVALSLPDGLLAVRGASRIDGRALRDRKKETGVFELGRIDARTAVELVVEAVVASPAANGAVIAIQAVLTWAGGERRFERSLAIRSEPFLPARRNLIEHSGGATVHPGDEIEVTVLVSNDGSAPATDAVLQIRNDSALDDLRVLEKNLKVALDGDSAEIGTLEPYASRRFTVRARVQTPYANRSEIRLGASLHSHELGETALGEAGFKIDSHPAFSTERSKLELGSRELLRPNQLAEVLVHLTNEGTDTAQNVRMRLFISPEARLESVDGATRDTASLLFGEIAPGRTAHARLGLRLLRSLAREYPVSIDGILSADGLLPVPLERLAIVTTAEPDFSVGTFRSEPPDLIDVGELVEYVLHVRNGGDGPARRVKITIEALETLIYVPGSTTVNDVSVRDVGAGAPFSSERGIVLNDVDPGVEAAIRWRAVVHNGLNAGEAIVRTARISYDGERSDRLTSTELKVRSVPSFANNIPGLPFGLDGMIGPAFAGAQPALPSADERFVELPPATPVIINGEYRTGRLALVSHESSQDDAANPPIVTGCFFDIKRLDRTLRFLGEAQFEGLVSHLFAIRAFFPDAVGATPQTAEDVISALRDGLHERLNQLFIKLRVSSYNLMERDIETPGSRATLERFLGYAVQSFGEPEVTSASALHLHGSVRTDELQVLVDDLRQAPLASAAPWRVLAEFLPTSTVELHVYREALIGALGALNEVSAPEFLTALQHGSQTDLDAALRTACASLSATLV